MRFLGFLTGVALLVILFVVFRESEFFSANEQRLKNDLETTGETVVAKTIKFKDRVINTLKQNTDKPAKKITVPTNPVSATVKTAEGKAPKQVGTPALVKDKIVVVQTPATIDPVEPDKFKTMLDQPTPKPPVGDFETLNKNNGTLKRLSADKDVFLEHPVQWHSFWGPFNTRNSARGFANNLAKRTTVEFKVIKTKLGDFMVAYPYGSANERQSTATLIEQRTGLRMKNN